MARPKKSKAAKMVDPIVDQSVDSNSVPVEDAPVEDTTVETTQDAPVEETPVETTADATVEDTPVETTQDAPVEETPVETTQAAPVEDMPVETTQDAPVEETSTPTEDAPVEETPVPTEDAPVEETPVETTEDAPVEETSAPVENAPVEDTPVPVEDTSADVVSDVPIDEIPISTDDANIKFEIVITDDVDSDPSFPTLVFIVPYRDRQKQYEFFSNHMKTVLEDYPQGSYKILYVHQQDAREFNRGAMKNIGFMTVKNMYPNDYTNITLVFNDIDTMPYTKNFLDYKTIPGTVKHFYGFKFTLGGIVSINAGDFERVNGFPNFWAWGYEDNMIQDRVSKAGLTIDRSQFFPILDKNILHFPEGITRNMNRTEFDVYKSDTTEGINTITDVQTRYDADTGFVHVQNFNTNRIGSPQLTFAYDLRGGNEPFRPRGRRGGGMRMIIGTYGSS